MLQKAYDRSPISSPGIRAPRCMMTMFCISPISAGTEPEMELNERSSQVRLCRSPIPFQ